MKTGLYILVVSEIILVNLLTLNRCADRKYSGPKTAAVMLLFSIAMVASGIFILSRLSIYGNGNGLFVWFGFLYLIPAKLLYNDSLERLFVMFCSAWVYTLSAFSVASQIGKTFPPEYYAISVALIQTGIFVFITPVFFRKVLNIYLEILRNIQPRNTKYLKTTSLLWFLTIFMVNFSITLDKPVYKIASVIILSFNAISSYLLLKTVIDQTLNVESLKNIVYMDALTGVPNRSELKNNVEKLISENKDFSLIYMDLDDFKEVNDRFGHITGDEYLCQFVRAAEKCIGYNGRIYRVGGDEFVGVFLDRDYEKITGKIEEIDFNIDGMPFIGVSVGSVCSDSHIGFEKLLEAADKNMYINKNKKKAKLNKA